MVGHPVEVEILKHEHVTLKTVQLTVNGINLETGLNVAKVVEKDFKVEKEPF